MYPDHDTLAPTSPSKPQRFTPYLSFILADSLDFPLFFLLATFDIFVVSRCPFHFPALVLEFRTVLLERGDRKQREFIVASYFNGRSWDDHR